MVARLSALAVALLLVACGSSECEERKEEASRCDLHVVVVAEDEPVGCNLDGHRLDVTGLTQAECMNSGGRYMNSVCESVDY